MSESNLKKNNIHNNNDTVVNFICIALLRNLRHFTRALAKIKSVHRIITPNKSKCRGT